MRKRFNIYNRKKLKPLFLQEFAFNIATSNTKLALLFQPLCTKKDISSLLQTIYDQIPISDETLDLRWIVKVFLNFTNDDISSELGSKQFSSLNFFKQYINFSGEITREMANDIISGIRLLKDEYPGTFYLFPQLQNIISKIPAETIYQAVGPGMISYYTNPPIDFFNKLTSFDTNNLSDFFKSHQNYTHPELTVTIQTKITAAFPYPSEIKSIENSKHFSLTNSSLSKSEHFIDSIYASFQQMMKDKKDSELIQKFLYPVLDFLPYFLISKPSNLVNEKRIDKFAKIFNGNEKNCEQIDRFLNDFKFLSFIAKNSRSDISYGDFFIYSFPFLLENSLSKASEILTFSETNFFAIFEANAKNDFDFVRAYEIFSIFLQILSKQKVPAVSKLAKKLNKISTLLENFENKQTQSKIIVDLFSCIFLQNRNGEYICHPVVAQQTIHAISTFSIPLEILRGKSLFETKKISKSDSSISPWLDNDASLIYKSIEKKNWQLAEKLTEFVPYYSKLFSQAIEAYKYRHDEDEQADYLVILNVLLSTKTQKAKLREIQSEFEDNEEINKIIERRLSKHIEPTYLYSAFTDQDKWQPVQEFCLSFDFLPRKSFKMNENFPENHFITDKSKSLDDFLSYLYKYYCCCILGDSGSASNLNDLFVFDFRRAVEKSILHDKMKSAEELSKDVNVDLFKYIFDNLSSFNINEDFIKGLSERFPLEATALSVSKSIAVDLPPKMKSISNFLNAKSQEKVDQGKFSMESILSLNSDDLEDTIFSVDHFELYRQLMQRFEDETIARKYHHIFKIISYVSTEKDEQRIKQIEILHHIWESTTKRNPTEIVSELYEKGEEYFQTIIDYLLYAVNKADLSTALLKLFSLSVTNPSQIEEILKRFPKHFDIIMVRFYYFDGVLSHLLANSPPYKKNFLKAVFLLPKLIITETNIFDIDSIIRGFINNPECIFEISNFASLIFNEENLFSILKGTINSPLSNKIFAYLLPFFTDKNRVINYWSENIETNLKSMNIDSIEKEDDIINFFRQINKTFITTSHNKFNQYQALSSFVELRPFLKFRYTYSFEKVGQTDFLNYIISISIKMDEIDVVSKLLESFEMNTKEPFFSYVHLLLLFGNNEEAIEMIQRKNLKIDESSNPRFYDQTFEFITPFTKAPLIQYELDTPISLFKVATNFFEKVKKHSNKNITINNESKRIMKFLFSKHCNTGAALSLFISINEFGEAFDILNMIDDVEERINLFINNVCLSAHSNNSQKKFAEFILTVDDNLEKTRTLWDASIDFFTEHEMPHAQIFALQIEKKFEDAGIVGFNNLNSCISFFMEAYNLQNIISNLKTSIEYRRNMSYEINDSQSVPVIINNNRTYDEVLYCLNISKIQMKACEFFLNQTIPFTHDYDVFLSDECACAAAAFMFINNQFDVMNEIKEMKNLSKIEIFNKACLMICKESLAKIHMFAKNINDQDRMELLQALSFTNNRQAFLSIICSFYENKQQEYLFLDYNLVVESFAIAYEINDVEIIPLIAHKASILGDKRTVDECKMFLKNHEE